MKILVTGACGYLGSVLVPTLLRAGHEVIALDNFLYNQSPLLGLCHLPNLTIVRGDCRDSGLVGNLIMESDFFFPLAAIVGAPACELHQQDAWQVNCQAIKDTVPFLLKSSCKIVFPNTNSGYKSGLDEPCTEDSELRPASYYGLTKVRAEEVVLGCGGISFRFATLFGASPRMRLDLLVNDFVYRAVRDRFVILFEAGFRRNYLHVRDAASAFLWAIDHFDAMKGKPYNVGLPDANLTKQELCEKIKAHMPGFYFTEAAVGEDVDKRDYLISNDRILATGWRPRYSLDDGIDELVKAYQMMEGSSQFRNA